MSATVTTTDRPTRVSHYVAESQGYPVGIKEEVFLDFDATWRGAPVRVRMQANRYTHSSGLSEWRIYAEDAREAEQPEGSYPRGNPVTDLARRRLSDALTPAVEAWLGSEDYRNSEQDAYAGMIRREAYDLKPYDHATRRLREMIERNRGKLTDAAHDRLVALADAYEGFVTVYREGEEA